jgi:phospholipid/cholesterol/gamma-HCH transport system substrate-binding protein
MTQTLARAARPAEGREPLPHQRAAAVLWDRARFRVLGIVFLALVLFAGWLTYALFTKKFTAYDEVTLRADRIGLQLPQRADVKIRGVIVGEVLGMHASAAGATLKLGIYPSQLDTIPADVTGAILPKTLFGEKYVSLVAPTDHVRQHLEPGAVIERSQVSTEVQQVLADIYPLLRTVRPAELNETLNALASALEGRGEKIGSTLTTLDGYLKRFNPEVPALMQDLRMATKVADTYDAALPEIGQILRNSLVTTTTLESRSRQLHQLLANVTSFSDTADSFLTDNAYDLIQVGRVNEPIVRTLARYSPEFPCLLGGLTNEGRRVSQVFRNYTLHIDLETLPRQPRPYGPQDKPHFGDDSGPRCGRLPDPPWTQAHPLKTVPNLDDGVDEPTGKGTDRAPVGFSASSYAGSPAETGALDQLLAPGLGVSAADVPDLGALLIGPMARGATVGFQPGGTS